MALGRSHARALEHCLQGYSVVWPGRCLVSLDRNFCLSLQGRGSGPKGKIGSTVGA